MVTAWKGEDATLKRCHFSLYCFRQRLQASACISFLFLSCFITQCHEGGGGNSREIGHICALCVLNLLFLCDLYVHSKSSRYSQILTVHSAEVFFLLMTA